MNRSIWRTWLKAIPGTNPAPECPAFEELLQVTAERKPRASEIATVVVPALVLTGGTLATVAAILAGSVAIGVGVGITGCALAVAAGWFLYRSASPEERTASKLRWAAGRVKEKHQNWLNQLGFQQKIHIELYPLLEQISQQYLSFQSLLARLDPQDREVEAVREIAQAMDEAVLRMLQIAEQCEQRSFSVTQNLNVLQRLSEEMAATLRALESRIHSEPASEEDYDLSIERLKRSRRKLEERAEAWEELHDG